jgi:hypothetical protein
VVIGLVPSGDGDLSLESLTATDRASLLAELLGTPVRVG